MARSDNSPSRSRVIAKSTNMMPFFLTIPINKMIPMMPMTERSKPAAHNASNAPDARGRQCREYGQRVDVVLIKHAEDNVDEQQCGRDQHRLNSPVRTGMPVHCP